jgi:hypothetical protein
LAVPVGYGVRFTRRLHMVAGQSASDWVCALTRRGSSVADFDGDGRKNVILVGRVDPSYWSWSTYVTSGPCTLSTGSCPFTATRRVPTDTNKHMTSSTVTAADLTGDGVLDTLLAGSVSIVNPHAPFSREWIYRTMVSGSAPGLARN